MQEPEEIHLCTIVEEPDAVEHHYCSTCHRILPKAEFRRRVTNALARAWGYHSARDVPYKYGTVCRECKPPPVNQTPQTMGPTKLVREAQKGNIPLGLLKTRLDGTDLVSDARKRYLRQQAALGLKTWHKKWVGPWKHARKRLRAERRVTYFRVKYNEANPVLPTDTRDTHDCATQTRALVEFYTLYAETLKLLIDHMTAQINDYRASQRARNIKPSERDAPHNLSLVMDERSEWSHYLHPAAWEKLVWAWRAVDPDLRAKRCRSSLLMMVNDATRLCLYNYKPEDDLTPEQKQIAAIRAEQSAVVKEAAARALQKKENDDENL